MRNYNCILLGVIGLLFGMPVVTSAQEDRQGFQNPRMTARIAATRAAIDTLERDSRALRKALVDSALGTPVWLEFSTDQLTAERRQGSLATAVERFLTRHRTVLGLDDPGSELREVSRVANAGMVHVRFQQYWRRIRVKGGELRVHLRQTGQGYVVETANGRTYPDIEAPEVPAFGPATAAEIASSRLTAESTVRVDSTEDGPLFLLPFGPGYRLAYSAAGTRRRVIIDARSGEVLDTIPVGQMTVAFAMPSNDGRRGNVKTIGTQVDARRAAPPPVGYVPASGTDALGLPVNFLVYDNGASFQLRSVELGYRVSEIIVRDLGGADIEFESCPNFPVASHTQTTWPPDDPGRRQQVSAMVNMVSTGNFLYDNIGRRSYDDALPGAPANLCVNGTYGTDFGAISMPDNTLRFVRDGLPRFLGAAAAKDVVTHEFVHNISRDQYVRVAQPGVCPFPPYPSDANENCAMNEAISDYFAARHRGSPRIADDAVLADPLYGQWLRRLDSTVTYGGGRVVEGHIFSLAFSGALWQVASLSTPLAREVDYSLYDAMRYYLLEEARMGYSREGIIRAAQDRRHANLSLATVVPSLEQAFWNRGVGFPSVTLSLWGGTFECSWPFTLTVGNVNRNYKITFESGTGLNQDQSVSNVTYSIDVAPYAWRYGNRNFEYAPSAVGGHQLGDGHSHAFRVRFDDGVYGVAGILLDYYIGWGFDEFCYAVPEGQRRALIAGGAVELGGRAPAKLTVRQVVAGADVSPQLSGGAIPAGGRSGLAAEVARSGLMTLDVGVPATARGRTTVRVYDLRGRLVRTIVEQGAEPGWTLITWDGRDDAGAVASAGVYLALVQVGSETVRSRLIVPAR